MSDLVKDETASARQLALVEKYEAVVEYLYPVLQNFPRKHGVVRDLMLTCLFGQVDLFIAAGKSAQPSRLYSADANLAMLRFWLRFAADPKRKLITRHQHRTAQTLIAEVGAMTGAWIRTAGRRG
jgi:hypothetical protein